MTLRASLGLGGTRRKSPSTLRPHGWGFPPPRPSSRWVFTAQVSFTDSGRHPVEPALVRVAWRYLTPSGWLHGCGLIDGMAGAGMASEQGAGGAGPDAGAAEV